MKPLIQCMTKLTVSFFCFGSFSFASVWPGPQPKLVVLIVIDQFRADYLSRFGGKFRQDGFRALMKDGAYYPYGEYDVLESATGPGHATVLTGAYPYQMGIPLNDWYDQKSNAIMYCTEDQENPTVGAPPKPHVGTSPKNLVGTTVGDELKNSGSAGHVISLALKDRAAILMGGHRADFAMWFDGGTSRWVSSRYYLKDGKLPTWLDLLNARVTPRKCDLETSCGTDLTVEAFHSLMDEYKLGQSKAPDLIAVSFSSHDYAGHKFGPNSTELESMTLSEDKAISDIRATAANSVRGGLKNTLFILTGDHGVAPSPDYLAGTGIESGRIDEGALVGEVEAELNKKYGKPKEGKWITHTTEFNFFLNERAAALAKVDMTTLEREIKSILIRKSFFAQVVTQAEYEAHLLPPGLFERQINKTFYRGRSGHVVGIPKPFFINQSKNSANHMTGYVYDRMVPILFSGFGIKSGVHPEKAEVIDIAPTLSFLLGILPPALSEGKVLKEALK